jgi:hypothetical protein
MIQRITRLVLAVGRRPARVTFPPSRVTSLVPAATIPSRVVSPLGSTLAFLRRVSL